MFPAYDPPMRPARLLTGMFHLMERTAGVQLDTFPACLSYCFEQVLAPPFALRRALHR